MTIPPHIIIRSLTALLLGLLALYWNRKIILMEKPATGKLLGGAFFWAIFCIKVGQIFDRDQWGPFTVFLTVFLIALFYFYLFFLKKNLKWNVKQFVYFISIIFFVPIVIFPFITEAIFLPTVISIFSHEAIKKLLMDIGPLTAAHLFGAIVAGLVGIFSHRGIVHTANTNTFILLLLAFLWGLFLGNTHMVFEQRIAIYLVLPLMVAFYSYLFFSKRLRWGVKKFVFFILSMIAASMAFIALVESVDS